MPLAPVLESCGAKGSENNTLFLRSRQLKWSVTWSCYAIENIVSVTWMSPFHSLCHNDWNGVQHNFWLYAATAIDISSMWCQWHFRNATISFVRSRWLKSGTTWLFWSYLVIGTDLLHSLYEDYQNAQQNYFYGHVTQLQLPLGSHDVIGVVTWCHWYQCHMMLTTS